MEPVFYNDEECREILHYLQQLTQDAGELPNPRARELVFEILQYFDLLHREALSRILRLAESEPRMKAKMEADFAIRTLLQLYELSETEAGFNSSDTPRTVGFVSADEVRVLTPVRTTNRVPGGRLADLQDQPLLTRQLEGVNVLICKVGERLYAVRNACVDTALPLDAGGYLEDHYLICPWHGCRYDLSTGDMLDKPGARLETFPVRLETDGRFFIEITKTFKRP